MKVLCFIARDERFALKSLGLNSEAGIFKLFGLIKIWASKFNLSEF